MAFTFFLLVLGFFICLFGVCLHIFERWFPEDRVRLGRRRRRRGIVNEQGVLMAQKQGVEPVLIENPPGQPMQIGIAMEEVRPVVVTRQRVCFCC